MRRHGKNEAASGGSLWRVVATLALLATVAGCGFGKQTPASSAGIADSAASSATRMPPPPSSGKAPSAP